MNKIKVVARIERDVKNLFFVRLLYNLSELPDNLYTAYEIKDKNLLTKVINMSQAIIYEGNNNFLKDNNVVGYNVVQKRCVEIFYVAGRIVPNIVIAGTLSQENFDKINNLLVLISKVMIKEHMGEFLIQYKEKNMSYEEFYSFQQNISLY